MKDLKEEIREVLSKQDQKKECGICTGLIFTVICPSCKLCSRRVMGVRK